MGAAGRAPLDAADTVETRDGSDEGELDARYSCCGTDCMGCWTGGATWAGMGADIAYADGMARFDASGGGYIDIAGSSILG